MNKIWIFAAASLTIISLTACGPDTPAPVETTLSAEARYIADVESKIGVNVSARDELLTVGREVCDSLHKGGKVSAILISMSTSNVNSKTLGTAFGFAVKDLCPDQMNRVQAELTS